MLRCKHCVMPATRPDTPFIDGVCSACLTYANRPKVDWAARNAALVQLLDRHGGRVLVPSSGGKDSTYQVMTLLGLGADVTVVTARTCHLTTIGRANIDNLARHARTIEVVPNMTVRAKLNRLGLEMVGDISWPEHAAIFSTPFKVAAETGHTLIMYGECPQAEYGGPMGSEQALQMTRRWRSEFGGFLGLRPEDFVGMEGITERDMADYEPVWSDAVEAHFLGQYLPWDSHHNAKVATEAGMAWVKPSEANWWSWENVDNFQTGVHDRFMWLKYGFGRGCQQISVDVRSGRVSREQALVWVEAHDHLSGPYMGKRQDEILDRIGLSMERYWELERRFAT
jgi:hypothetical protein